MKQSLKSFEFQLDFELFYYLCPIIQFHKLLGRLQQAFQPFPSQFHLREVIFFEAFLQVFSQDAKGRAKVKPQLGISQQTESTHAKYLHLFPFLRNSWIFQASKKLLETDKQVKRQSEASSIIKALETYLIIFCCISFLSS